MNRFIVEYPAGRFDVELCVGSGQVFRWESHPDGSLHGVDGGHWFRITGLPPRSESRDALTYVSEERRIDNSPRSLHVESNAGVETFLSLFRLDWDADAIEREILQRAPEMEPYLGALGGLRLMHPSDPIESFFSFLCTPNNNLARIKKMVAHLASYGEPFAEGKTWFPRCAVIAEIPEADLRSAGFGYRAATIPAIARQVMERGGDEWIQSLVAKTRPDRPVGDEEPFAPYHSAHRELVAIKGIGPKLADCICLFALNYTEAAPVDTHLWQAITRIYFPEWQGKPLTDARYYQAAEFLRDKFGNLAGWAHQHLFYDNMLNWRRRR